MRTASAGSPIVTGDITSRAARSLSLGGTGKLLSGGYAPEKDLQCGSATVAAVAFAVNAVPGKTTKGRARFFAYDIAASWVGR